MSSPKGILCFTWTCWPFGCRETHTMVNHWEGKTTKSICLLSMVKLLRLARISLDISSCENQQEHRKVANHAVWFTPLLNFGEKFMVFCQIDPCLLRKWLPFASDKAVIVLQVSYSFGNYSMDIRFLHQDHCSLGKSDTFRYQAKWRTELVDGKSSACFAIQSCQIFSFSFLYYIGYRLKRFGKLQ